ncbi:hypothetical protein BTL55_10110 [Bordetella trematum]|uniref:hypothetical protein n=1 Tax=Bordetella trematum TaxID=123899 RepID=UPI0004BB1408|nr:hypothetical protein [Bordetella trematum]AUL47285.1 hypothetical protein BTL55_10110 [Bordetella trematum]
MKNTQASQSSTAPAASLMAANMAYCQRLAELARQSQARWMALGNQVWTDQAARSQQAMAPLTQSHNWQDLAPAMGELARRNWQQRLSAAEAVVHTTLAEQAALTAGVSEALNTWLQDAAGLCQTMNAGPMGQLWSSLAEQMGAAARANTPSGA